MYMPSDSVLPAFPATATSLAHILAPSPFPTSQHVISPTTTTPSTTHLSTPPFYIPHMTHLLARTPFLPLPTTTPFYMLLPTHTYPYCTLTTTHLPPCAPPLFLPTTHTHTHHPHPLHTPHLPPTPTTTCHHHHHFPSPPCPYATMPLCLPLGPHTPTFLPHILQCCIYIPHTTHFCGCGLQLRFQVQFGSG